MRNYTIMEFWDSRFIDGFAACRTIAANGVQIPELFERDVLARKLWEWRCRYGSPRVERRNGIGGRVTRLTWRAVKPIVVKEFYRRY